MQTMPARIRTAMTVGAILLGVAIVGAVALYANRGKTPTAQNSNEPYRTTQEVAGANSQQPPVTNPLGGGATTPDPGSQSTGANDAGATMPTGATGGGAMLPAENGEIAAMTGVTVPEMYTVAAGESLRGIAMRFYGNALYSADIEEFNQIPDPDHITAGQVLMLPRPEAVKKQ